MMIDWEGVQVRVVTPRLRGRADAERLRRHFGIEEN